MKVMNLRRQSALRVVAMEQAEGGAAQIRVWHGRWAQKARGEVLKVQHAS
jgi:hypothetical protein